MRPFSRILFTSLVVSIPALFFACNGGTRDDDGMGGEGTGGGDDGESGGSSSGGRNSSGGASSGGSNGEGGENLGGGGLGGDGSGGGSGGTVTATCEVDADETFEIADCTAVAGPAEAVTSYCAAGAFTDVQAGNWTAGWTNWSTTSTPEDAGGPSDGTIEDCDSGTCVYEQGIYDLEGTVYVADGATIEFEPGTIIRGASSPIGILIISRGGKINAVGTAEEPIIFTSSAANGSKVAGGWGGLVLLGQAKNFQGDTYLIEGLEDDPLNYHGGLEDDDDSGELKYVRLEFSGIDLGGGFEINGLSLGSIGSETDISYVQVNTTLDDGFEWFGGTVSTNHLVVNNAGDDMFDADDGYRGTASYLFGRHVASVTGDPNGFEIDGDSDAGTKPAGYEVNTEGSFEYATLCTDSYLDGDANIGYGAVLRRHYAGSIDSAVFVGFDYALDLKDDVTEIEMTNTKAWDFLEDYFPTEADPDDDEGVVEEDWFLDQDGNETL